MIYITHVVGRIPVLLTRLISRSLDVPCLRFFRHVLVDELRSIYLLFFLRFNFFFISYARRKIEKSLGLNIQRFFAFFARHTVLDEFPATLIGESVSRCAPKSLWFFLPELLVIFISYGNYRKIIFRILTIHRQSF